MPKFKLPFGVQDYLPDYLENKNAIQNKLLAHFSMHSYSQIDTSIIASYDVYSSGIGSVPPCKLFKMSDTDGNLLVLRPDMTLPITRIVATKMTPTYPLRLSYVGQSFNLTSERMRPREFTQTGIELYGVASCFGDIEVITLAIESMIAVGLKDFQIDIGCVKILKGILNSTQLSSNEIKDIIEQIDKKNTISASQFYNLDTQTADIINSITSLYGDAQVLSKAKTLVNNDISRDALSELNTIYQALESFGYADYISFDLGLVNSFGYYSGTVFKGITKHFGSPILGGGRYDDLALSSFNQDIKATGFAIGISDLMTALARQGVNYHSSKAVITIGITDSLQALASAHQLSAKLALEGQSSKKIYYSADSTCDYKATDYFITAKAEIIYNRGGAKCNK